jgi:ubiquinone/menaquinone biosynthesis C-methylase UbiE
MNMSILLNGLLVAAIVFLLGIPPYSYVLRHFFNSWHPVARQLRVVDTTRGLQSAYFLRACIDLGIFDALRDGGPLSVEELSSRTNTSSRGVEAVVNALAQDYYLLVDSQGRVSNSATVAKHLVSGLPASQDMTPLLLLQTSETMVEGFSRAAEAIRSGGSVTNTDAETPGHSFWELFSKVTSPLVEPTAISLMTKLSSAFGKSVLDIATGSGQWGFQVLKQFPEAIVTLQDYENVLAVAKENAVKKQVDLQRLHFLPGDVFQLDLQEKFDTIMVPQFLHHFSREKNIMLLKKIHDWLTPGGHVVIMDLCPPDHPYSIFEGMSLPRSFSMTMLVWSKQGKAYTVREIRDMLKEAGFDNVNDMFFFPFVTAITAKPII